MFGIFFDKNYEECLGLLGVNALTNQISYGQLLSARDKNKSLSNSNPNEAAARTFRDLVVLNEQLPADHRIALCLEKIGALKIWHFDGKVNQNLYFAIKEDLDGLIERYVGKEYMTHFYQALSKMGLIVPVTHDQLRTYSLHFIFYGKRNQYPYIEAAKRFMIDVVAQSPEKYSNCAREEAKELIFVLSKEPTLLASTYSTILDSIARDNSATQQLDACSPMLSSADAVIQSNSSASRVFLMAGENPASPKQFGLAVAKIAIDTTRSDVTDMIGTQESAIQQGIASRALLVHLHLFVLQSAVSYVYAAKLLALPKDVLAEIHEGIMEGFAKFLVTADGRSVGGSMAELFHKLFSLYGNSLFQEAGEESSDYLTGMGPTASLVTNAIAHQCDVEVLLNDNPMERLRLELIASRCGIGLLWTLWKDKSITFVA